MNRVTERLLAVRDLRVEFRAGHGRSKRRVQAVRGVSFDLQRGSTLGLVGESGCGKTTLGRAILRLVPAVAGGVLFDDVDVLAASASELRRLRQNMQMVFQDSLGSLNPRLTVGRSIAEPLVIHARVDGRRRRETVADLLRRVGLRPEDADRYPHELSGGQRQRVGIARALALRPKLVICDEPVSALDVSIQAQILNLLRDLQDELRLTYIFISHDLAVVKHISNRVAVMYLGKIVETAPAPDLYARPQHPYTIALLAAVPTLDSEDDPEEPNLAARPGGEVPDPSAPPTGCAFHPRCPIATRACTLSTPALGSHPHLTGGHLVACHHVSEASPTVPRRRSEAVPP